jgi:3-hydroxyacyl-CoA dehydrogenase
MVQSDDNRQSQAEKPAPPVAVVGAGSIGTGFTAVFAMAGRRVKVYDPSGGKRQAVRPRIAEIIRDLREFELTGQDEDSVLANVLVVDELTDALDDVDHVQECGPEQLDLKRELFAELDKLAPQNAVLASSSSAIPSSQFAAGLECASRCLVVHPANPPFLIRVVEVVPSAVTSSETVQRTRFLLESMHLSPILVKKEPLGFVFNRLQGALLREAYCLVRDGVATVEDIDRIVRDGLGLRWSVTGPFETVDLNTQGGIASHAEKLGAAYAAMGTERGQHDPWTTELVRQVEAERRALLPLSEWQRRVRWRDRELMSVISARRRNAGNTP